MRVLLVQPNYYTRFPPLGLLKLSTYHKKLGDETYLVKGCNEAPWIPDKIYVTSLFTYAWKPVHDAVKFYKEKYPSAKIILGGIYATLMPEHAAMSGAKVHQGIFEDAEDLMPDYSLEPEWGASIIFSSRGCIRKCPFCAVPKLEPNFIFKKSIKNLIYPSHKKVIFWDNNLMASPCWKEVLQEVRELGLKVDFNQGIDARILTPEKAETIASLKTELIRIAFDGRDSEKDVEKGVRLLIEAGVRPKKILAYLLYNFDDSPEDLLHRLKKTMEWGIASYPMRYQPISGEFALKKDSFVGPKWTAELLEQIADARRVLGKHGAFPPYEGLKAKFLNANTLEEALELRPKKKRSKEDVQLEVPLPIP